ncbi:terpenoid synthase [Penicillium herquei]|nr:terpenoid synthase [Penicillium herquei]
MSTPLIRPIHYAFDPIPHDHDIPTSSDLFPLLRECLQHSPLGDCVYIQPTDLRVPWPTFFPAAVQCKHWQEVEKSARKLLDEIVSEIQKEAHIRPQSKDKSGSRLLSTQLGASPDALPQKKLHEVLETAVTGTIYMFPAANAVRARIMAKAILLIFLHDDVVESHNRSDAGETFLDLLLESDRLPQTPPPEEHDTEFSRGPGLPWRQRILREFVNEVLSEDPISGLELLQGLKIWSRHTRSHIQKDQITNYTNLQDYLEYRMDDLAADFDHAAIHFTANVYPTATEVAGLSTIRRLYLIHASLTNDLYSYAKELHDLQTRSCTMINSVRVLQDNMMVGDDTAKDILRRILLDVERQLHAEHQRLRMDAATTETQNIIAQAVVQSLAGNLFYSATTYRYARVVEGAELV